MNAQLRVGFSVPSGAVCRALVAALLLPVVLVACDILGPSEGFVLEPFETTWLSEPEPIDPVTHPPEDPPPGEVMVDSLFYRAELMVQDTALGTGPMSLTLQIRLRNPFDDPVTIRVPGCPERPRAYATADRVDPPFWDPPLDDLGLGGCVGFGSDVTVPPRDEITGGVLVRPQFMGPPSIRERGLPDGRHYFTMEFHRVDEDPILLPVGSADVRLQEPGLEFDVSLEDSGGKVHVDVRLTNRNDVPIPLEWGGCAMTLVLYHDSARTNLAREFGFNCFDFLKRVTPGPGDTMHPDEFVRDYDPADLDLPSGTYFLSVRVRINWFRYLIPAGEIGLR